MMAKDDFFHLLPVDGGPSLAAAAYPLAYLLVGFIASVILYFLAKTLLRPFALSSHSFVRTNRTKTRAERKAYEPPAGYFLNKDNLYIHTQTWLPAATGSDKVSAVVVLAHGVGEHCGRYTAFAKRMCNSLGIAVIALDHQGHGKSEGDRLFVVSFDDYLEDIRRVCLMAKDCFPGAPLIMLGHSLGGLMAIRMFEKYPELFAAAVFSAPALSVVASKTELELAPYLSKYLPHLPTNRIDPNLLSHDACIVDLYCNDPLCTTQGVTARLGCETLGAIEEALAYAGEITKPYLLIRGAEDRVTLKPGIEQFLSATPSREKSFVELPGLFHEIFNEPKGDAQQIVVDWLDKQIRNEHQTHV